MNFRHVQITLLILLLAGFNMATVEVIAEWQGWDFTLLGEYHIQQIRAAVWTVDFWLAFMIGAVLWKRLPMTTLFRQNLAVNLISLGAGLLIMLSSNPLFAGRWALPTIFMPLFNLILLAKTFHLAFVQENQPAWRIRLRPIATSAFGILALLLLAESAFSLVEKSQLNDNALASKIWFKRNWALNELGYREAESHPHINPDRRQMLFIGDSFLAGHGVSDPSDRFTDRIQAHLGPGWQVHNHGQNGAATQDEASQLWNEKPQPEIVVLCWFLNDIHPAAELHGHTTGNKPELPYAFNPLHHSFFLNFIYWKFSSGFGNSNYMQFLKDAFADKDVIAHHKSELRKLEQTITAQGSKFIVVLFPMMNAVRESEFAIEPMKLFWKEAEIPCLDLRPALLPFNASDLIVNSSDTHPNEKAHSVISKAILQFIEPMCEEASSSPGTN